MANYMTLERYKKLKNNVDKYRKIKIYFLIGNYTLNSSIDHRTVAERKKVLQPIWKQCLKRTNNLSDVNFLQMPCSYPNDIWI